MTNLVINLTLLVTVTALTLTLRVKVITATTNCTCSTTKEGKVVSADCSHLGWTQVPRGLPSSLLSLNLSNNLLSSVPSSSFIRFPLLETLDLSHNRITKLENQSFSGLLRLLQLSLETNLLPYFPGTFPGEVFKELAALIYLDLHNQTHVVSPKMAYPDEALSTLGSLRTLRVDGLSNNVDLGVGFAGLWQLEELYISDETGFCKFTELSETFFASINTSRPLSLNMSGCELTSIHSNAFSHLPTLYSLDLFDCRHFSLSAFMEASKSLQFTQVKVLNISYDNRAANIKIKAEYFQYLGYTWLEQFKVDGIEAYDIALQAISNLPTSLRYLSFMDNKLINATFLYGMFLLPHIETVQISKQNHFSSTFIREGGRKVGSVFRQTQMNEGTRSTRENSDTGFQKMAGSTSLRNNTELINSGASNDSPSLTHREPQHVTNLSKSEVIQYKTDEYDSADKIDMMSKVVKTGNMTAQSQNTTSTAETVLRHLHKFHNNNPILPGNKVASTSKNPPRKPPFLDRKKDPSLVHKTGTDGTRAQTIKVDPSICLDPQFRKTEEERLYKVLRGLKDFLINNFIPFQKTNHSTVIPDKTMLTNQTAMNGDTRGTLDSLTLRFPDDNMPLPPTLKFFLASDVHLDYILPRIQFLTNSLEVVDVSSNRLPCFIGPWLGLTTLGYFHLSNNLAVYLSPDFFQDMPSLTHLYLQRNFLGDSLANDLEGRTFGRLQNLEVLNLADNYIKSLSMSAFKGQGKLKTLSLARNAMSHFQPRIGHMTSLTFLDLFDNNFGYLQRQLMEDLDTILERSSEETLTVDLYQNALSCGCEALDFWFWVARTTKVRLHRIDKYTCSLNNGSEIRFEVLKQEFDFLWLQCQGERFLTVAIAMLATLLVVLIVLGTLHYKRWHLRYFYYVGLSRYRHPYLCYYQQIEEGHPQPQGRFRRDVFISFDEDDPRIRLFVQNVLRPAMDHRGMSYFISEIDFPGYPIKDIIPRVVLGARKTLTLLSAHFFPSYEREVEFNMAVYHEEATHRRVIVPVLLERVDWSRFPAEVLVYLEERGGHFLVRRPPSQDGGGDGDRGDDGLVDALMERIDAAVRR